MKITCPSNFVVRILVRPVWMKEKFASPFLKPHFRPQAKASTLSCSLLVRDPCCISYPSLSPPIFSHLPIHCPAPNNKAKAAQKIFWKKDFFYISVETHPDVFTHYLTVLLLCLLSSPDVCCWQSRWFKLFPSWILHYWFYICPWRTSVSITFSRC